MCFSAMLLWALAMPVAQAQSPVNVIEIGNFYCPHCFAAQNTAKQLEYKVIDHGGRFAFMPIFTKVSERWPALVYLGLKFKAERDVTKDAFFNAAQVARLNLSTLSQTCQALKSYHTGIDLDDCIKAGQSDRAAQRYRLILTFMKTLYKDNATLSLPIFVFERNGKIIRVTSADNAQLIDRLSLERKGLAFIHGQHTLSAGEV